MLIPTNSRQTIVLLQVDVNTMEETEHLSPAVAIWTEHTGWKHIEDVKEVGAGWYSIELTETETAQAGPLIIHTKQDGMHDWRDIHQIVDPAELLRMVQGRTIRAGSDT